MRTTDIFLGADLRMGVTGLKLYAKARKVDLNELEPMTAVAFVNRDKTGVKLFTWNKVVAYIRAEEINRPIDLDAIQMMVQAFNEDGTMNYTEALRATLIKTLEKKGRLAGEYHLDGDTKAGEAVADLYGKDLPKKPPKKKGTAHADTRRIA